MGVSFNVHVGPYLRVQKRHHSVEVEAYGCINKQCRMRHEEVPDGEAIKFCSFCGTEINLFMKTKNTDSADVQGILGLTYEDSLCSFDSGDEEYEHWLPNHHGPRDFTITTPGVETLDGEIRVYAEIEWFKKQYKKELALLKKALGKESVLVSWGIVSYSN